MPCGRRQALYKPLQFRRIVMRPALSPKICGGERGPREDRGPVLKLLETTMADKPLMPIATAVWLIENTRLTFDQIADFCVLHPLQVKGIADGDVAAGVRGIDPITNHQLSREELEKELDRYAGAGLLVP